MRAHLVQTDIVWEDRPANHRLVRDMVAGAGVKAGELVVLPELFDTGFSFNLAHTADRDGATLSFLVQLAASTGALIHGSRTVIGADGRGRNRVSVTAPATAGRAGGPGRVLAEYDKIHPFTFGREGEFFSPGDLGAVNYPWDDGVERTVVGAAVCYDLRFPELFRRLVLPAKNTAAAGAMGSAMGAAVDGAVGGAVGGAEVFALGANWPAPRAVHRVVLSQARAIENQAFMLSVNRCGSDPAFEYEGGSRAFGPKGELLGELGSAPGVLSVELDLVALRSWRATFPALRDARL